MRLKKGDIPSTAGFKLAATLSLMDGFIPNILDTINALNQPIMKVISQQNISESLLAVRSLLIPMYNV